MNLQYKQRTRNGLFDACHKHPDRYNTMPTVETFMSSISYLATAQQGRRHAAKLASSLGLPEVVALRRRGRHLGWLGLHAHPMPLDIESISTRWRRGQPIFLPSVVTDHLGQWQFAIKQSRRLLTAAQKRHDLDALLSCAPFTAGLRDQFEMLATSFDEQDPQEIATIEFDAVENTKVIAENLWMKASWLSLDDHDQSVRFRFSFGLVNYEDVAADFNRECLAAGLCETLFPESALVSRHPLLHQILQTATDLNELYFVERIVYFNAPNGGALMHQDVERGHCGVVFVQASGRTAWFTLSTEELIAAIQTCARQRVPHRSLCSPQITTWLTCEEPPDWLTEMLNNDPGFAAYLAKEGHGYVLNPGDALLLPQASVAHCAWHSVFCLGHITGEGLSFALRGSP